MSDLDYTQIQYLNDKESLSENDLILISSQDGEDSVYQSYKSNANKFLQFVNDNMLGKDASPLSETINNINQELAKLTNEEIPTIKEKLGEYDGYGVKIQSLEEGFTVNNREINNLQQMMGTRIPGWANTIWGTFYDEGVRWRKIKSERKITIFGGSNVSTTGPKLEIGQRYTFNLDNLLPEGFKFPYSQPNKIRINLQCSGGPEGYYVNLISIPTEKSDILSLVFTIHLTDKEKESSSKSPLYFTGYFFIDVYENTVDGDVHNKISNSDFKKGDFRTKAEWDGNKS